MAGMWPGRARSPRSSGQQAAAQAQQCMAAREQASWRIRPPAADPPKTRITWTPRPQVVYLGGLSALQADCFEQGDIQVLISETGVLSPGNPGDPQNPMGGRVYEWSKSMNTTEQKQAFYQKVRARAARHCRVACRGPTAPVELRGCAVARLLARRRMPRCTLV